MELINESPALTDNVSSFDIAEFFNFRTNFGGYGSQNVKRLFNDVCRGYDCVQTHALFNWDNLRHAPQERTVAYELFAAVRMNVVV